MTSAPCKVPTTTSGGLNPGANTCHGAYMRVFQTGKPFQHYEELDIDAIFR